MFRVSVSRSAACCLGLIIGLAAAHSAAFAASFTLNNGSVVNVTENALGEGATGVLTGTIQSGGATQNVTCTYDAATGAVTGSPACSQILGGAATGGLSLSAFAGQVVAARLSALADLQAESTVNLFTDVVQRRIGTDVILTVQADQQDGGSSASSAFGDPQTNASAIGGAGFFDDERLGREQDGKSLLLNVGIDRTAGDFLIGTTLGYVETNSDLISLNGDLSSKGWLLGGYATYVFNEVFSLTGYGAYVDSNVDIDRIVAAAPVTADYDQKELSAGISGNAFTRIGSSLGLSFIAGLGWSDWKTGAYTDSAGVTYAKVSDSNTMVNLGTVLTLLSTRVRPYVAASFGHYLSRRDFGGDRDNLTLSGGFSFTAGALTGSLEVSKMLLVEDISQTTVGAHMRLAF